MNTKNSQSNAYHEKTILPKSLVFNKTPNKAAEKGLPHVNGWHTAVQAILTEVHPKLSLI